MKVGRTPGRGQKLLRWIAGIGALVLFLVSIQLLKSSIGELAPTLRTVLPHLIRDDLSALGTSWLAAYLLLNGSVVAALALSLFSVSLVTPSELVLMVFGSRLGAAGIVLLVGMLDFFQRRRLTVRKASELGIIAFLVTHTIGIPAAALSYLWIRTTPFGWMPAGPAEAVRHLRMPQAVEWLVGEIVSHSGPLLGFALALVLLVGSLRLFSLVFEETDFAELRERYRRFHSRWVAFGMGLSVTALTTSIAFSLGIIVPIYNRGYLRHREVLPYIFGANVGTLFDTILISLFVEVAGGLEATLLVAGMTMLVTLPALVYLGTYQAMIESVLKRLLASRSSFVLFLVSLVLVPLGLIALGWGSG